MSNIIVSCPQINYFEKYIFFQIPIVSWMFPKMLPKYWMFASISTVYSTEFTSSIRHKWLTFLFLYTSSYSFYTEYIHQSLKKRQENTLIMILFPAPSYGEFVFWVFLRFWKKHFLLEQLRSKVEIIFSKTMF